MSGPSARPCPARTFIGGRTKVVLLSPRAGCLAGGPKSLQFKEVPFRQGLSGPWSMIRAGPPARGPVGPRGARAAPRQRRRRRGPHRRFSCARPAVSELLDLSRAHVRAHARRFEVLPASTHAAEAFAISSAATRIRPRRAIAARVGDKPWIRAPSNCWELEASPTDAA